MAYTPSLNDLSQTGYQPSLDDLRPTQNVSDIYQGKLQEALNAPAPSPSARARIDDFMQAAIPNLLLPESKAPTLIGRSINNLLHGAALNTVLEKSKFDNNETSRDAAINSLIGSGIAEALPYGLGGAAKAVKTANLPWNPGASARNIVEYLGGGAKNAEENAQAFAKEVYENHLNHANKASELYKGALEKHGNKEIYPTIYKPKEEGIFRYPDQQTAIKSIPDINVESASPTTQDFYQEFKEKPTLLNAHKLQSQIFTDIAETGRMPPGFEKRDLLNKLNSARDQVNDGIESFLKKEDPAALKSYQKASNYFRENVVPYRSDKTLRKIAEGQETNPGNLHTIFDYPSDVIDKQSRQEMMGPIKKVVADMQPQTSNRILFSKLGVHNPNLTPEALGASAEKARQGGYSSYFTPELDKMLETMGSRAERSKARSKTIGGATQIAGGLTGAGLAHYLDQGGVGAPELVGALIGSPAANVLVNSLKSLDLSPAIKRNIANTLLQTYKPLIRAGSNTLLKGDNR